MTILAECSGAVGMLHWTLHSRQGVHAIKGAEHAHHGNAISFPTLAMTPGTDLTAIMMCLSVLQVECPVVPDARCDQCLRRPSLAPSAREKESSVLPSSGLIVGHFLQRQDQGSPAQASLVSNSGNGFGRVLVRAKRHLGCMTVLDSARRGCLVVVVVVSPGVYRHHITVATSRRPRPSGTAAVTRFPGRHACTGHALRTSRRLSHVWYDLCSLMPGEKG